MMREMPVITDMAYTAAGLPVPDAQMVCAFRLLADLHAGGQYWYYWRGGDKSSEWHQAGEAVQLPISQRDVYFGVHPTAAIPQANAHGEKVEPARVRSHISNVAVVNALFAEFDAKDYCNSKDLTLAKIDSLFAPPSAIIDSGGGYHCYFLLDSPFVIDSQQKRERIDRAQKDFVIASGGDRGAKDLARVLRVPGTVNGKYNPARNVIVLDYNGTTYALEDLEALTMANMPVIEAPARAPDFGGNSTSLHGLSQFVGGRPTGERNKSLFWAACRAFDKGATPLDVAAELSPAAHAAGLDDREIEAAIRSASAPKYRKVMA